MIILKGGDLSELGKRPETGRRESSGDQIIGERIEKRKAKLGLLQFHTVQKSHNHSKEAFKRRFSPWKK